MTTPINNDESRTDDLVKLNSTLSTTDNTPCTWQPKFKGSTSKYVGYVESVEAAMDVIKQYELETTTKFSCFKSDKTFGAGDPFAKSRKVYFKDERIPFDGVPFSIIGSKVFDCQHGPDRKKAFKARQAIEKVDDHSFKKRRFLPQDSMKFGCTASIRLSEVITYPSYKIRNDTERLRRDMSKKLKTEINSGKTPPYERRIYIYLPKEDDHKDHITGEVSGLLQPIDKRLVDKIEVLVGEGVNR